MENNINKCYLSKDSVMSIFINILEEGGSIRISPHGFSMYPYIVSDRDELILAKPKKPYRRGDIVLYRRDNGNYVVHRLHHVNRKKRQYYMLGDSQTEIEGPLRENQLIAVSELLIRNGKEIAMNNFWYRVSYHLWFLVRIFRRKLIKMWRKIRHVLGKKEEYQMPW